jgi:UDP-N-acetylglucosamine--N-acetylmuramyl-(pentapeptide) pyrophosphoryl-undecaprenol N-acetylglucosamine transferase
LDKTICRETLGISKETFFVVSFGGSGGAKKINDTMLLVLNYFKNDKRVKLIHVTGKSYYEKFVKNVDQAGLHLGENTCVKDYLFDIPKYLCAADLVVGRAGATTLAELLAVETPSILIPSPNVADDHQTYNAKEMERLGVSVMMKESELSDGKVSQYICDCLEDSHHLDEMKSAFGRISNEKAAKIIVKDLMHMM